MYTLSRCHILTRFGPNTISRVVQNTFMYIYYKFDHFTYLYLHLKQRY